MKRASVLIPLAVALTAFIGGRAGAGGAGEWYALLEKPPLTPPGAVFGPVWALLYILIAISALIAWKRAKPGRHLPLALVLGGNLALNAAWSPVFFVSRRLDIAALLAIALFFSTFALTVAFYRRSRLASYLNAPYLLWTGFAAYLAVGIWILNI